MSRRVVCCACANIIDVDDASTALLTFKSPPEHGIQTPVLNVEADVCSAACLRKWLTGGLALADLERALGKWVAVGGYRPGVNTPPPERRALPRGEPEPPRHVPSEPFNPLTFPVGVTRKR